MNSLMAVVLVVLTTGGVVAEGRFMFGNRCVFCTPPLDARVFASDGVTPLVGTAGFAQAYVKRVEEPDSSYRPVGTAVNFRTGNAAGYIVSAEVATPFPAGTTITVQMRAWEASGGTSYEAAVAAGESYGVSKPVTLTLTEPPDEAPYMIGLSGFGLTPDFPYYPKRPTITRQPVGMRVAVDHAFALRVVATGGEPGAYQWYRDNQPLAGGNDDVLSVAHARLTDTGGYQVIVRNLVGSVTSDTARVVVGYPLTLEAHGPGRIGVQPAFEIFEPGEQATLTAVPEGGALFEGWQGDVLGMANPATLVMDGPKQVQAWFALVPLRLDISWLESKARIAWTSSAVLQVSDALAPGDWQDVTEATSPYDVEPANAQRFYRLRRPRRGRCARPGGEPSEGWQANGLGHGSRGQRPRTTASLAHALKGHTNPRPVGAEARLSGPLQGAEILEGAGSEGDALGYDGSRPSGGGHAGRTAYKDVRRHRPWDRVRSGRDTLRSLIIANPAVLTMDGPKQVQAWFALAPLRLDVSWHEGKARIAWTSSAVLQVSDALLRADWQDVSGATNP